MLAAVREWDSSIPSRNTMQGNGTMLIYVDPQGDVPVYRQLIEQIRFLIASGRLAPGKELPSTRALSAELGVNPMTISKAYAYLERDGLLERRPGLPLIVKDFDHDGLARRKADILREKLMPIVGIVRQLDVAGDQAVQLFQEMLKEVDS
jgi:GntR family transcriptional regulator